MSGKIKSLGLVLRPDGSGLKNELDLIRSVAFQSRVEVYVLGQDEADIDALAQKVDMFLSLGGDGTMLGVARNTLKWQKPLLGIHFGRLGFLTLVKTGEIGMRLKKVFGGDYEIEPRIAIDANIRSAAGGRGVTAINEVVFRSKNNRLMNRIKVFFQGRLINTVESDGLIFSTPNGSTAYNLAAGGPILWPSADSIIMTSICSHALGQLPLVLPGDIQLELEVESKDAVIIADGQEEICLERGVDVTVKKSKLRANFVTFSDRDFFMTLEEKLGWGGR